MFKVFVLKEISLIICLCCVLAINKLRFRGFVDMPDLAVVCPVAHLYYTLYCVLQNLKNVNIQLILTYVRNLL